MQSSRCLTFAFTTLAIESTKENVIQGASCTGGVRRAIRKAGTIVRIYQYGRQIRPAYYTTGKMCRYRYDLWIFVFDYKIALKKVRYILYT